MVQYAVLLWSHAHSALLRYTDNIRILEGLAASHLLSQADADLLSDAYRAYREVVHRKSLQEEQALVSEEQFADFRRGVLRIWAELLEGSG